MFASEMKEPAKVVVKSNILDKKVPATPSRSVGATPQATPQAKSAVRPASEAAAPAAAGAGTELPPVSKTSSYAPKECMYKSFILPCVLESGDWLISLCLIA